MPKIALRYTGDDEATIKRLEANDGVQLVEPVDAREILSTPDNEYEIDEESRKLIGLQLDPRLFGANAKPGDEVAKPEDEGKLNIPQLHGMDAELQTGLSAEKYGRSQVVKAVTEGSMPTAMQPMTTTGRPLDLEKARSGEVAGSADPTMGYQQKKEEEKPQDKQQPEKRSAAEAMADSKKAAPSEGMTTEEMKAALQAKNVQFPPDAKKAELAELVDRHNARKV